jgi:hypothetical protein
MAENEAKKKKKKKKKILWHPTKSLPLPKLVFFVAASIISHFLPIFNRTSWQLASTLLIGLPTLTKRGKSLSQDFLVVELVLFTWYRQS